MNLSCKHLFPCCESQSTLPPWDALQYRAGLWTCCGESSDSNMVHSCVFLPLMSTSASVSAFSFSGSLIVLLCIPQTKSLPSWSCRFKMQLVLLVGKFCVLFLSHTAPGFQLWFYFHLCIWVVHLGLLLSTPLLARGPAPHQPLLLHITLQQQHNRRVTLGRLLELL